MSNNDMKKLNFIQKYDNIGLPEDNGDDMHNLFSLSLLSSKKITILSENLNNFNFDLQKSKLNYINIIDSTNEINNKIIPLVENDNNQINKSFLKIPNNEINSLENLWKNKNEVDFFLNEYDNSFWNFLGINKKQFEEAYINNKYMLSLNKFGDINISKKITDPLLKTDSSNSKMNKKYLKKKIIFYTSQKKTNLKANKTFSKVRKKNKEVKININNKLNNNGKNKKIDSKKENYNNKTSFTDNIYNNINDPIQNRGESNNQASKDNNEISFTFFQNSQINSEPLFYENDYVGEDFEQNIILDNNMFDYYG